MANVSHKKRSARIGVKGLVFQKLTSDDATGVVYETDQHLVPGTVEIGMAASISDDVLGADDNPTYDMYNSLDSVDVDITLAALGTDVEEFLLGKTRDVNGVLISSGADVPPWVAMGFKSVAADGSYDYTWLYKGKFKPYDSAAHTKEKGTVNFQTPKISATFGHRDYDDHIMARVNDQDDDIAAGVIASFLSNVYGQTSGITIIGAALYNVTEPVKDATPQSTHDSGTGYTAAIEWSPDDTTFAGSTVYTATVTLTAAEGYAFAADFGVADVVNLPASATAKTVTRTDSETVVIEVVYPATGA